MTSYVYIFVRQDLKWPDIVVQACHAAMDSAAQEWRIYNNSLNQATKLDSGPPHLVLIGIRSKEKLAAVIAELTGLAISVNQFHEPDMNNELTAVATEYLREDDVRRKTLGRYKLLNAERA